MSTQPLADAAELAFVAAHIAGMSMADVRLVHARMLADLHRIEARMPERTPLDDPGRFELARDRAICERLRRAMQLIQGRLNEAGAA
jgi:hypothetical protein